MRLSTHITANEETHAQSFRRRREKQHTCRMQIKSTPVLLWVTAVAAISASTIFPLQQSALVQAHDHQDPTGDESIKSNGEEEQAATDPEIEKHMNDFLEHLKQLSYLDLLVKATHDKKFPTGPHRGPPVMIGRRRHLLEHNVQHHFSGQ